MRKKRRGVFYLARKNINGAVNMARREPARQLK